MFSFFVKQKLFVIENFSFIDRVSGIRFPDCRKLALNREKDNDVIIC